MGPSSHEPGVGGNIKCECSSLQFPLQHSSKKSPRRPLFREEGCDDLGLTAETSLELEVRAKCLKGFHDQPHNDTIRPANTLRKSSWYLKIRQSPRSSVKTILALPRLALLALLVAVVVQAAIRYSSEEWKVTISGAEARFLRRASSIEGRAIIEKRGNSPIAVCTRWGHQTANVNGTLYIYGGRATTQARQISDTWNSNFLTLDLSKSWQISAPALSGLPQPPGPPQVSEGCLWNTHDSLFLYGGEFSDDPPTTPLPVSTWEYQISSTTWIEYSNPRTSAGNNSDGGGRFVQRAAEGAAISVPEIGKSWYFGGHLDLYTTPGWSNQIARVYLKSLLEFTHPGYTNTGIRPASTAAGSGGVYRNITSGGLEADFGFTERADGVLVYIPGWGNDGIILGLAGGTNQTYTEMNVIDVFDIASSAWYKQSTSGASPPIRVNPCAVVAAAADGSSFNVYLYGGQNLLPFGSQTQYADIWILTIPSFTWIQVDLDGQSQPPARAGHTCNMWDGQMVVVGGYVGKDISCDSPGVFVFNASSLQWSNEFTAKTLDAKELDSSILRGSTGYQVPPLVQAVVGGSGSGGATVSIPATGLPSGLFATGRPPTITVTRSGITIVQTSQSTATVSLTPPPATNASAASKPESNIETIIAGVAAVILALLAAYLAFCSWLYRRQLRLYRNHVAMAQRTAFSTEHGALNFSARSEADTGGQINGAEANEVILGPFGTAVVRETSSAPHVSTTTFSVVLPGRSNTTGWPSGGARLSGSGDYGRSSDVDEDMSDFLIGHRMSNNWPIASRITAHSSMEDLLGGQEPSFSSVVLNPRRTLRVVNSD